MVLTVIIVNWNTKDCLALCLASIYEHPQPDDVDVVVIDNASSDGSVEMVRERFPQTRLIASNHNAGFAAANNQAIAGTDSRYVLLLNPDTVVQPGAFQILLDFMDANPDAGAAGPMLLNPDHTLQVSSQPSPTLSREAWRLFHLDVIKPVAEYPMTTWTADLPREVDTLKGACIIVRREVIDQIGLLDDSYFMYSEEVDWCRRIRQAGWKIFWVPKSQVIHHGAQSTRQVAPAMFIQLYRAKVQYFRKHFGNDYSRLYKGTLLAASAARLGLAPLAWLLEPARRKEHTVQARNYAALVKALPGL